MTLRLTINGAPREIASDPDTPLAYVLRNELGLKGTKIGCALEQCGSCHVLLNGQSVPSCVTPVSAFEGREVVTVEGIGDTALGRRVQEGFVAASAAQCGYCTAGLVVAVTGLLSHTPQPDRETVKATLAPHLCRCGSHPRILRAVELAQEDL